MNKHLDPKSIEPFRVTTGALPANRTLYSANYAQVSPQLASVLDVKLPDAGFYLWAGVKGGDDIAFARGLLAQYNVAVLPGSLLAREAHGVNPGSGRIRNRW